jgi:hypothetical protein
MFVPENPLLFSGLILSEGSSKFIVEGLNPSFRFGN